MFAQKFTLHDWEGWEFALYGLVLLVCAPNTWLASPIQRLVYNACALAGINCSSPIHEGSAKLAYLFGILFLAGLLYLNLRSLNHAGNASRLIQALAFFASLYALDWFLSTEVIFAYQQKVYALYAFSAFFLITLLSRSHQAQRLVTYLLLVISVESVSAVIMYISGDPQFVTPLFGRRAGGTFHTSQPSTLFPLAMLAIPLGTALATRAPNPCAKGLYAISTLANLLSLILTFSRAGWIGTAGGWLWLAYLLRNDKTTKRDSLALCTLALILLLGAALVRTQGRLIGNAEDRSTRGRIAIWKVATRAFCDHPFIGSGIATYTYQQARHMSQELQQFVPGNLEAKNLLLNMAVEMGCVGVLLWIGVWWRYFHAAKAVLLNYQSSSPTIMGCTASFIALHIASLFDTPILHWTRFPSTLAVFVMLGSCAVLLTDSASSERNERFHPQSSYGYIIRRLTFWGVLTALFVLGTAPFVSGYLQFRHYQRAIPTLRTQNPARPRFTPLAQIAPAMRDALIASEDGYFLQHHGVDWQALHRALRVNIRNLRFKQGGSTITMQAARYLLLGREKTLPRKVAEILLALEMERHLSKERILELYLNSARFELGAEDIGTACAVYFGKKPSELTLAEAGFLAGVLPEPPRTREELTPEKVERCKRRALGRLAYFFPERYSPQQIERALQERMTFVW